MKLYAGFDLHSNNSYLGIINEEGSRVFKQKLGNEKERIKKALKPHKDDIEGVVVESTYNWYWLVDILESEGYAMHLANPAAIKKYSGLKHSNDKDDALWLAECLRLDILPEGYIYPKEKRAVRDLLRKRGHLVRLRTSLIVSLQHIITRNFGVKMNGNDIKNVRDNPVGHLFAGEDESLAMAGLASKDVIDFLAKKIREIERAVLGKVKLDESYECLLSVPGVGKILALTIMLETGPISRFEKVGNYSSYCRKVTSKWTSNGKMKGHGNKKNGNKYLAWAFSEAAELARCHDPAAKKYYERKLSKSNRMVAHNALAHKLARASYYVMRDGVPFSSKKLFV
jgi:transposase